MSDRQPLDDAEKVGNVSALTVKDSPVHRDGITAEYKSTPYRQIRSDESFTGPEFPPRSVLPKIPEDFISQIAFLRS